MFTTTFRTRSHEEFLAAKANLTAKAKAGTLTQAELSEEIGKYYDDGDYIDQSFGTNWIISNPGLFAEVVPAEDRLRFLIDHLDRPHCSEVLICHETVLNTLPTTEDRTTYVREAFIANGARNNYWVPVALKVGVPKGNLFLALATRMHRTPAEDPERNYTSPFGDFLSYGDHGSGHHGRAEYWQTARDINDPSSWVLPEESPWGICSYSEFCSLVAECAEKAPRRVFEHWRKLSAKLKIVDVKRLLAHAAIRFQTITGNIEALLLLEQHAREYMLRTLKPGDGAIFTQLMVHTVLSAEDPRSFYEEIAEKAATVDPLTMWLTARPILDEHRDNMTMCWLFLSIQARLHEAGYRIGTVREGTYEDRRRQETRRQFFVEMLDGSRYIPDRDYSNRRYYPSVGDEVIFNPSKVIRRLTPKVFTVGFIPVDASKRR